MKFNAKDVTGKVQQAIVNAVDKNGNGKLDREDFSLDEENLQAAKEKAKKFAVTTGQNVKIVSESLGRAIEEAKLEMDRRRSDRYSSRIYIHQTRWRMVLENLSARGFPT